MRYTRGTSQGTKAGQEGATGGLLNSFQVLSKDVEVNSETRFDHGGRKGGGPINHPIVNG